MVGGSTRIPLVNKRIKEETGKEPESGFNPDEVVALGAAIQAAWKYGELKKDQTGKPETEVRDAKGKLVLPGRTTLIVSHSLGVKAIDPQTNKPINSIIIRKGKEIPGTGVEERQMYTTQSNGQRVVEILLLEGEEEDPEYCRPVGSYLFEGIPARPAGRVKIIIRMKYDQENIVHVKSWALETDKNLHEITPEDLENVPTLEEKAKVEWLDEKALSEQKNIVGNISTL
ncbi:MAG: Hsp70 family protein [bacterium]|nr:Hsp70 family protein [bacterium]